MLAVARIALAEFAKAFAPRTGTPAARDFLWLTVFFTLSAFIVFVGWSARAGVWDRFEQVLLGALPEGGPPIRVRTHIDLPQGILPSTAAKFAKDFPQLSLVPLREFQESDEVFNLPGLIFGDGAEPDKTKRIDDSPLSWGIDKYGTSAPFIVMALPTDSPLWRWIEQRPGASARDDKGAPLVVAANRSLFQKHFRYDKFRKAIVGDLAAPCGLKSSLPEQISDPRELKTLPLRVRESFADTKQVYQSFAVDWVDSFPLPEQVALIVPLQTAETVLAAATWPDFDLYLEGRGVPAQRISELRLKNIDLLSDADRNSVTAEFEKVAACLGSLPIEQIAPTSVCGAPWTPIIANDSVMAKDASKRKPLSAGEAPTVISLFAKTSFDVSITTTPEWPIRKEEVRRCTERTRFVHASDTGPRSLAAGDAVAELTPASAEVRWKGPSRVELPCDILKTDGPTARLLEKGSCEGGEARGIGRLTGYTDAMVYAGAQKAGQSSETPAASLSLDDIVTGLLEWTIEGARAGQQQHVFRLDPTYESALVRFGVLSTIVDKMAVPLGGGMLVLYLVLSGVILATTFLHRRSQYGLLLMNGVRPWGVEFLVLIQIALGCTIGCILGYAIFMVAALQVNSWLKSSEIIHKAAFIIGLDAPTFLGNLTPFSVVVIWVAMMFAGFAIGSIILRIQGISTARAPIDLIKS